MNSNRYTHTRPATRPRKGIGGIMTRPRYSAVAAALAIAFVLPSSDVRAEAPSERAPRVTVLNDTALGGLGSGSAIGPDGALYVTNGNDGTLVRINPRNGSETVVGSGLPPQFIGIGGAMDVAFIGHRAYVLVTAAGSDWGPTDAIMGIYRLKHDGTFSVFADLGAWSAEHPPADPDWFAAQGVHYSMDVWRHGFVVADAHLGRVIRVDQRGRISELVAFDSTDSVPTGLEVANGKVFVTTAGPIPHIPSASEINKVRRNGSTNVVGEWDADYAGNRGLIVDVEKGPRHQSRGIDARHHPRLAIASCTGSCRATGTSSRPQRTRAFPPRQTPVRSSPSAEMAPSRQCCAVSISPRRWKSSDMWGSWSRIRERSCGSTNSELRHHSRGMTLRYAKIATAP